MHTHTCAGDVIVGTVNVTSVRNATMCLQVKHEKENAGSYKDLFRQNMTFKEITEMQTEIFFPTTVFCLLFYG